MLIRTTPLSHLNATSKVTSKRRKPGETHGESAFALEEDHAEAAPALSGGVASSSLQGVDSLLALQQMDVSVEDRRRAVHHGNALLDQLDALRVDMLLGHVQPERLERIVTNLGMRVKSGNAALDQVVEDIELRARIELAKLGHYVE